MDSRSESSEVLDSIGMGDSKDANHDGTTHHEDSPEKGHDDLPEGVKARLGRQEKRHQKEMRDMRNQMEAMHTHIANLSNSNAPDQSDPYQPPQNGAPAPQGMSDQDKLQQAYTQGLRQREADEKRAQDAQKAAHVHQQYAELQKHLDSGSDKYDDFHEVVTAQDVPFTTHMRDASLLLPRSGPGSAVEVLYKLGKNRDHLDKIRNLHPIDQAAEMIKISHALIAGENAKPNQSAPNSGGSMGNIKSNPASNASRAVHENTPVSELRARMKKSSKAW